MENSQSCEDRGRFPAQTPPHFLPWENHDGTQVTKLHLRNWLELLEKR